MVSSADSAEAQKSAPLQDLGSDSKPTPQPSTMKVRKRGRVHPLKWGLMVTCVDMVAIGVVLLVALPRKDLAAGVYAVAGGLAILCVWIYTMAYQFKNWLLQWTALLTRVFFSTALSVILWDVHRPHKVWQGESFEMSSTSPALLFCAACFMSTALLLGAHAVFFGRGYHEIEINVHHTPSPADDPAPTESTPKTEQKNPEAQKTSSPSESPSLNHDVAAAEDSGDTEHETSA